MSFRRVSAFLCIIALVAIMLLEVPVNSFAATGDVYYENVSWNGQTWEMKSFDDTSGNKFKSAFVDENNVLNVVAPPYMGGLASDATHYTATWSPATVTVNEETGVTTRTYNDELVELKALDGRDSNRNNDSFDLEFRMRFENKGQFFACWYQSQIRMVMRNANTLMFKTSNDNEYEMVTVNMGTAWHDWKFEVRGIHVSVYMDGREIYSYNLFRQPAATRYIQFRTDYEHDYQGKIQVQNLTLTDKKTSVKMVAPQTYSHSKNSPVEFVSGEPLKLTADAGATADYKTADVWVNEDFSLSDIDFNDKVKYRRNSAPSSGRYAVESVNGYMHFFKSIEGSTQLDQRILLPSLPKGTEAKDYVFEYDMMIPDPNVWTQREGETKAFMYFDIFFNHPVKSMRQTMFIENDRIKVGSTSFYFKNICGTANYGGIWMSFKHYFYFDAEADAWKCDFYYKRKDASKWSSLINATMNSVPTTENNIRLYAYPEDQTEICMDNIRVYTSEHVEDKTFKTVDFYVNGLRVGSGVDTASVDASYTLKSGLPAGKHKICAVSEGVTSSEIILYVNENYTAELICVDSITYGEQSTVSVNCSDSDAETVKYYVDGELYSTSAIDEKVSISGLSVGTHTIDAVVYCEDGTALSVDEKYINVSASADNSNTAEFNREYRVDYKLDGSGSVKINDGYFTLSLLHNADGSITYNTIDNERNTVSKTYTGLGDGEYRVVATAGNAEVYYNGQFAFSMLMPYIGLSESLVEYSDGISEFILGGSSVKATRVMRELDNEAEVEIYNVDFSKYYSVEFDKNSADDETIMIYDGTYEAVVELGSGGVVVNSQLTTSAPTDKKILSSTIPTGYYRITVGEGMAQLFVDNVIVGTWRCPLNIHRKAIIRHITDPQATTFVAVKDTDDIYYHFDDFDDSNNEDGFGWKDYWFATDIDFYSKHEKNNDEKTNVYREFQYFQGNDARGKCMSLKHNGEYVLNINAVNPKVSWFGSYQLVTDLQGNENTGEGFELRTRYMNDGNYIAVKYNYADKTWTGVVSNPQKIYYDENGDRMGSVNATTGLWVDAPKTGERPATFATGVYDIGFSNHVFELEVENNKFVFRIDGNVVLESDKLEISHSTEPVVMNDGKSVTYTSRNNHTFGRLAFVIHGGALKVDDFSYAGEGKAMAGQRNEINVNNPDFYRSLNGNIVGGASDYGNPQIISTDNGKSWHLDYAAQTGKGKIAPNTINLLSGNVLRIQYKAYEEPEDSKSTYTYAILYSEGDDSEGTSARYYSSRVRVEPLYSMNGVPYSGMGSRLVQLTKGEYAGRVIYTRGGSGEEKGQVYMYYSDDYKDVEPVKNPQWHEPNVQLNYDNTGGTVFESQVVEMPDGVVRCYIRSDKGYLSYYESFDGGATWDPTIWHTENLITPSCCYSIKRVGETDTYFAFFEYDTVTTDLYYLEHPRNRAAMAVSYDGMKTWEYVGDIEERGISATSSTCNHSLTIVDNWLFSAYTSSAGRVFIQDMNKVKPLKRFSSLHARTSNYMATSLDDMRTDFCVIQKETGEAFIYGKYILTDVSPSGFVDANVLAKVGGATVLTADDTGVTITLGDAVIRFNDGEEGYVINGSFVNCDVVCCEGNYLNVKVIADIFDKKLAENDDAYVLMDETASVTLIEQFENVGAVQSVQNTRIDNMLLDINTASKNGNDAGIDAVFAKYGDLLNVSFDSLSEVKEQNSVFHRMTGIEYRTVTDVVNTFEKAVAAQIKREKEEDAVALSTVSASFEQWSLLGKNKGTANEADGVLTMNVAKGFDETYVYGTPGLDIPQGNYIFTFDFMKTSGESDTEFYIGNEKNLVRFVVRGASIEIYGDYSVKSDVELKANTWYTFAGLLTDGKLTLKVTDDSKFDVTVCEEIPMEKNSLTRGFWSVMDGTVNASAQLRKVRVYKGKALDVISHTVENGKVSATVELLNDGEALNNGRFVMGIYNNDRQAGIGVSGETPEKISAFGTKQYTISNVEYTTEKDVVPEVRFFVWDGIDTMIPLAETVKR